MRSGNEFKKDSIANIMIIDLNVHGALMKGGVLHDEDGCLIVKIH